MWQILLSSLVIFVSTSIDYIVLLTILFGTLSSDHLKKSILLGQYLGTALLVCLSLAVRFVIVLVPEEWLIGLLGVVPIYIGIRAIFRDEEIEEEAVEEKVAGKKFLEMSLVVTLLTLASGGDNLGVYIPYFASLSSLEIAAVLLVFGIGTFFLCQISYHLAKVPKISETIERYEKIIVPLVFISLGFYILAENGSLSHLLEMLKRLFD